MIFSEFSDVNDSEFEYKNVNTYYLNSLWRRIKNKQKYTIDYNGVSLKLLSLILPIPNIYESLVDLFYMIINFGEIPSQMKESTIAPLIKNSKNSKSGFTNMRPIHVLPEIAKIFEKIIYGQLLQHLNNVNYSSPLQFGFRKNFCTEHVLLLITDYRFGQCSGSKYVLTLLIQLFSPFLQLA